MSIDGVLSLRVLFVLSGAGVACGFVSCKRVSATQCKVCNTRGNVTDMVKCIYETCGHKYHVRCLSPPLDKVC